MSGTPALWTRNRGLAVAIAGDYYIPGSDRDDVVQEALIALWVACQDYDPSHGVPFKTFARMVVHRRLASCLKYANRPSRLALTRAERDLERFQDRERQEARDRMWAMVEASRSFTHLERVAVQRHVQGTLDSRDKQMDNALTRARQKLRRAA